MPQIGWFEILIIAAIAIIVVGPKDFPVVLKKIGSWIGTVKRYISTLQQEVSNLGNEKIDTDTNEVKTEKKTNDQK
jgi:sec-independent protein translocase protein TatB